MKNNKVLKIILIIILVAIVIFGIWFIRKYMIVTKIAKAIEKIDNADNYSCIMEMKTNPACSTFEFQRKDKVSLGTWKISRENESLKGLVEWCDHEANEQLILNLDEQTISNNNGSDEQIVKDKDSIVEANVRVVMGRPIINKFSSKIKSVFGDKIERKVIDGEQVYRLIRRTALYYFDVETGLIKRVEVGIQNAGGPSISDYKEWKFNEVTDEDVKKPDITGYKIIDE